MKYDLVVIGGGPGGYVGAIRAAQLGKKVLCVEKDRLGGTCLNWGCIPTKALLKNAEVYSTLKNKAKEFGLKVEGLSFDWSQVVGRSRKVSDRLAAGIGFLFKKNQIESKTGTATITAPGKVQIEKDGQVEEVEAEHILVTTGSQTRPMPGLPFDGKTVLPARDAMILPSVPESMVIIGAGAIGVEFAYIYNSFGCKVTIVEMQPRLLPIEDDEIGDALGKSFAKQGIKVKTGVKVTEAKSAEGKVSVTLETPKGTEELEAEVCLVAIGVTPVVPAGIDLGLDAKGYIKVDDRYQTQVPGVYAAGDIIGPPWLAHVASFEAVQAVEGMFIPDFNPRKVGNFPGCTYCHPQVASVGMTERAVKEAGIDYKIGKFPFQALGKAQASGDTEGFVKLIYGKQHGELLGAHIIGDNATEIITSMGLVLDMEGTSDDIHASILAHPTLSEAIHEATLAADGHALHM